MSSIELIKGGNGHPSTSATLQVWLFNFFDSTRIICENNGIDLSLQGHYLPRSTSTQVDLSLPLTIHKQNGTNTLLLKPTENFISELINKTAEFSKEDRQQSFSATGLNNRFRNIFGTNNTNQNGWKFFKFQIVQSGKNIDTRKSCFFKLTFRGHLEDQDDQTKLLEKLKGFIDAPEYYPNKLVDNLFSICKDLEVTETKSNSINVRNSPDGSDESSKPIASDEQAKLLKKVKLSKNLILDGVPGTGKTFAFKNTIVKHWKTNVWNKGTYVERKCQDEAITMHPSTSYEDFLEGLRPAKIEQPSYADNLNIPLANNRFIVRETSEIIYVEDRTDNKKRMATVPKSLLGGFLQHANQQGWNHEYNQTKATDYFKDHTTWNVWPLSDGATFHGVAKYYIEHGLTINDSLGKATTQDSSFCTVSICNKQDIDSSHWFFQAPTTTKGNFTVADGFFLNVCKQAVQNPSKDFLVLLDEINRCNIPSVFGDLLTAIERSKRATWDNDNQCWNLDDAQIITLAISKRKFFVPENVYVVGTMNTTDRSVAPMDMALRRRFAFHQIEPKAPIQENFPLDEGKFPNRETYWALLQQSIEALTVLNEKLAEWGKDALLGYSYIYDLAADLERYGDHQSQLIKHHWNHHILPQLSDILFSNQINDTAIKTVLASITTGTHGFTIQNTSTNTNNSFERPTLSVGE